MKALVYSRPACVQCTATYNKLESLGIEYDVIDVDQSAEARAFVLALDYTSLPVVILGNEDWSGFRPDLIQKYAPQGELFPE